MKSLLFTLLTVLVITTTNAQKNDKMSNQKPYTILVLMNASPKWLSLSRNERSIFFEEKVKPIFQKVGKTVKVGLYDSEYFHSKVSDFMIVNATNLEDYKLLIELLRDTKIYGEPYFEIIDIIVGQENLFEDFNEKFKKEK
jgi:hypothetical protein